MPEVNFIVNDFKKIILCARKKLGLYFSKEATKTPLHLGSML
jgi:hypothetical protein